MNQRRFEKPERRGAGSSFRELDDLVFHLKGLVLVRRVRERDGADSSELDMYAKAIDQLRDQLADVVTSTTLYADAA